MVSEDLKEFIEERFTLREPEDFKALEDFLEGEQYLSERARAKLLEEFADRVKPPPEGPISWSEIDYDWGKMKIARDSRGRFTKGGYKL